MQLVDVVYTRVRAVYCSLVEARSAVNDGYVWLKLAKVDFWVT